MFRFCRTKAIESLGGCAYAGPVLQMPVLGGSTSPKASACISTQPAENSHIYGHSSKPGELQAHSPAASNVSHRSLQSEALSQLSCNPGAITFRKVRFSSLTGWFFSSSNRTNTRFCRFGANSLCTLPNSALHTGRQGPRRFWKVSFT